MNGTRVMAAAALLLATGICIGALGAHALQKVLTGAQLKSLDTAVSYQQINALGLLLVGLLIRSQRDAAADAWLPRIAWALGMGVIFFSGGIYIMLAGAPRLLGLVTPLGGVLMIAAWGGLAWRLVRISAIPRR